MEKDGTLSELEHKLLDGASKFAILMKKNPKKLGIDTKGADVNPEVRVIAYTIGDVDISVINGDTIKPLPASPLYYGLIRVRYGKYSISTGLYRSQLSKFLESEIRQK